MILLGESDDPTAYMFHWGAMFNQCQAIADGDVTHIKIYCRAERVGAGSRVAIYDSTNLLKEITIDGLSAGWNTIEISSGPTIVQDNYYYIAWIDGHGGRYTDIAYRALSGIDMLQINAPGELETLDDFEFPSTVPSEWDNTYENCIMAISLYDGIELLLVSSISEISDLGSELSNDVSICTEIIEDVVLINFINKFSGITGIIINNIDIVNFISKTSNITGNITSIISNSNFINITSNIVGQTISMSNLESRLLNSIKISTLIDIQSIIYNRLSLYCNLLGSLHSISGITSRLNMLLPFAGNILNNITIPDINIKILMGIQSNVCTQSHFINIITLLHTYLEKLDSIISSNVVYARSDIQNNIRILQSKINNLVRRL